MILHSIKARKGKTIMGRAQELFDKATKSYDEAIKMIRGMDEVFQNVAYKNDPSRGYDTRVTLAQFDMILQGVLLSLALSDGDFDRLEQQFVDKITDYGDLLTYIKKKTDGKLDMTWSQIARLDAGTQKSLVEVLPAILDDLCDSFVKPLALVDNAIDTVDFLETLQSEIGTISACLSQVDGDSEQREARAAAEMVVKLLSARWIKYRD